MQTEPESILVVRFSSIGDILLTTPVLRALKKCWPDARITYLTKEPFAPLVIGNPNVDRVVTIPANAGVSQLKGACTELARENWDLLLDLHRNMRSRIAKSTIKARHYITYNKHPLKRFALLVLRLDLYRGEILPVPERYARELAPLGVRLDQEPCELFIGNEDRKIKDEQLALADFSGTDYLAIAPGAAWANKRWPKEKFLKAARKLAPEFGDRVLILGGAQDREICNYIHTGLLARDIQTVDLSGRLPILSTAAALENAGLLLCNDSGIMHIATAIGAPVIAMFGPTVRQLGYFPYQRPENSRVMQIKELRCRPCTHNGLNYCPMGHFRCMKDIKVKKVVGKSLELIRGLENQP